MTEKWKDVSGWKGYYQVSNRGNVRSVDRTVGGATYKGKLLKQSGKRNSYQTVYFSKGGKVTSRNVHVLVAEAFVKGHKPGFEVHHRDQVKSNNHWTNLEWVEKLDNHLEAVRAGAHCKKLTRTDTADICDQLSKRKDPGHLASRYGVTREAIYYIRRHYLKGWDLHKEYG